MARSRSIRQVLAAVPDAANRIEAICACGQMHGTVLIDAAGPTDARHRAALERQAGPAASGDVQEIASTGLVSAGNGQSADAGLAGLQAAVDEGQ
jgi:xylulokinase